MKQLELRKIIELGDPLNYEDFKASVENNILAIFGFKKSDERLKGFVDFCENDDHGMLHAYNVYKKAVEIANFLRKNNSTLSIDYVQIYLMCISHDSGRFHINPKTGKRLGCERKHNICGVAQIKLGTKRLKERGIVVSKDLFDNLTDYVTNHDYFNRRLDPLYKEPSSLEGQIVRLADRISTDIVEEINRYWATGKRLKTPYFIDGISFEDRISFDFTKVREYIKNGKFDEFTFFLALISMSHQDFEKDDLKLIYQKWAIEKQRGVDRILEIAKEEGFGEKQIEQMKKLIDQYKKYFNILF